MKNFAFDLYGTLIRIRTDENSPGFRAKISKRFNCICGRETDFWIAYDKIFGGASPEEELDFIGVVKTIAEGVGAELSDAEARSFALYFRRASTLRLGVYRGVRRTLKKLRKSGARLFILSNAQSSFTLNEIKKCRLERYFDGIELSSDFGRKKPCEKFFIHLSEKYSLDLSETVYTGNDYACDVIPSKSLDMTSVYVHTDISPDEDDLSVVAGTADFVSEGDFRRVGKYLISLLES